MLLLRLLGTNIIVATTPDADSNYLVCTFRLPMIGHSYQTNGDQHPHYTLSSEQQPKKSGPIRVAPNAKRSRRPQNVFMDDRGYPDLSDEFDTLLHNHTGGHVLRKRKHPAPALDDIDPTFNHQFDEARHGKLLRETLKVSHLPKRVADRLTILVKKYWPVFAPEGQFVPVKDYEFHIDTGSADPLQSRREIMVSEKHQSCKNVSQSWLISASFVS